MGDESVTIFHNPACGTSRNVVELVRAAGYAPVIVDYLKVGWTSDQLRDLFGRAGVTPREALRVKDTRAEGLRLTSAGTTSERIIDAMVADPALVNRPFVVTDKGARLCRPSETVLDLLDRRPESFIKEDGERVV